MTSCAFHSPSSLTHPSPPQKKQENLKILKQYAKLLSQACHQQQQGGEHASAHAQPLSPNPPAYPRNLAWFEPLAKPYTGTDATAMDRVNTLLELHQAACGGKPDTPRQHAYQLAKTLPHFDRDLTAYYLLPLADTREYELHVAHSILRLHSPATLEALQTHLKTWRSQGLLHVLSVAALHMPELADWFPVETPDKDTSACSLAHCLEALRNTPVNYVHTIESFIASQDPATPTAQAIAVTVDRLAVLMGVKSNSRDDSSHDLAGALSNFPNLDALEAHDIWARIKPSLEQAFPPSLLRLDPAYARKRVSKKASGSSWCAPLPSRTHTRTTHRLFLALLGCLLHPSGICTGLASCRREKLPKFGELLARPSPRTLQTVACLSHVLSDSVPAITANPRTGLSRRLAITARFLHDSQKPHHAKTRAFSYPFQNRPYHAKSDFPGGVIAFASPQRSGFPIGPGLFFWPDRDSNPRDHHDRQN